MTRDETNAGLFVARETTGAGFGLGIVSEIAEAHGWEVSACDGRDGGARFEIRGVSNLEDAPVAD